MPTVQQLFAEMPNAFNAEKAGDFSTVIQFDLSGDEGGQWVVTIVDGACAVAEGVVEEPAATLHMAAADYADMVTGKLDPMSAFIQQKVRIEGDLSAVMKFQTVFDN